MIKAANNNIIVLADEKPTTTKSGLSIPITDRNNEIVRGVVISVGSGKRDAIIRDATTEIKNEYIVYFPKFNATELTHNSKKYLIIEESYILAYETEK